MAGLKDKQPLPPKPRKGTPERRMLDLFVNYYKAGLDRWDIYREWRATDTLMDKQGKWLTIPHRLDALEDSLTALLNAQDKHDGKPSLSHRSADRAGGSRMVQDSTDEGGVGGVSEGGSV